MGGAIVMASLQQWSSEQPPDTLRPMTTTTTTTPGHRAILLGFAALATLAKGLAWLLVLALVLAQLDWLLPRKPVSNESMDAIALVAISDLRAAGAAADADLAAVADELAAALAAPAPVEPMVHPLFATVQLEQYSMKGLRYLARDHGCSDWSKATRPQLMASLYGVA